MALNYKFDDFIRFRQSSFASRSTIAEEIETPILNVLLNRNRQKSDANLSVPINDNGNGADIGPNVEAYKKGLYDMFGARADLFLYPQLSENEKLKLVPCKVSSKSQSDFRSAEEYWKYLRTESEIKLKNKYGTLDNKNLDSVYSDEFHEIQHSYIPSILQTHILRRQALTDLLLNEKPIRHCADDLRHDSVASYIARAVPD